MIEARRTNRYIDLLSEIDRAFDFFNGRFAKNKLVKPIIIVSPSTGASVSGWFGVKRWACDHAVHNEINLVPPSKQYQAEHLLETLLHEMAHLKNWQKGIEDVNQKTQHHNDQYKIAAISFGLKVRKGKKGYAYTSLGEDAWEAIEQLKPDRNVYNLYHKK